MRSHFVVLTALALATLGCASLLGPQPRPDEEAVVVAARDLEAGETITADDLRDLFLAPEHIPDGALRTEEQVIGRALRHELPAGWMIHEERLVDGDDVEDAAEATWVLDNPLATGLVRSPATADVVWMRTEEGPCRIGAVHAAPAPSGVALTGVPAVVEAARGVPDDQRRLVLRWSEVALPIPDCEEGA